MADVQNKAHELAKSISALDAILWIKSAINELKPKTVRNCFIKSGFDEPEHWEAEDDLNLADLRNLLKPFGESAVEEYAVIDDNLQTEDISTDVQDLIASINTSTADGDEWDEENSLQVHEHLTSKETMEKVRKLPTGS